VEQQERYGGKVALNRALEQAGFRVYEVDDAARRLRRIGRARAKLILPWLKDLDMKLKGSHSTDDRSRFALEEFVMRMG
jgi:predicted ATPase